MTPDSVITNNLLLYLLYDYKMYTCEVQSSLELQHEHFRICVHHYKSISDVREEAWAVVGVPVSHSVHKYKNISKYHL